MSRPVLAAIGVLTVIALCVLPAPAIHGQQAIPSQFNRPAGPPVVMALVCDGDALINVSVQGWAVRASKSNLEQVRFLLAGGTNAPDDVEIVPKPPIEGREENWPFEMVAPIEVRPGGQFVYSGPIRNDAPEGTYYYNIEFSCGGTRYVIDPRWDIDP